MLNIGFVSAMTHSQETNSANYGITTNSFSSALAENLPVCIEPSALRGYDFQGHDLHEDNEYDPILCTDATSSENIGTTIDVHLGGDHDAVHAKPLLPPPILMNY